MEKSRLPLFRRRKSKSPKSASSGQPNALDRPAPDSVSGCHRVAQQGTRVVTSQEKDRSGGQLEDDGAERTTSTAERSSAFRREIRNDNLLDRSADIEETKVGKPSDTDDAEEATRDGIDPQRTRETGRLNADEKRGDKRWRSLRDFISPKDVISTAISGRSALISEQESHYSQPLSKDLLERVKILNADNHKARPDEDVPGPDLPPVKQRSRSESTVTSDSSTSPHHDYVELDYGVVYEECISSPDYTELNLQSSFSSSDKSDGSIPGTGLTVGHQSSGLPDEGHYSRLSQRNEVVSDACHYKQRGEISACSCPCCVDVNEALSEGDVEVIDAGDGLANSQEMAEKRRLPDAWLDANDRRPAAPPVTDQLSRQLAAGTNQLARLGDDDVYRNGEHPLHAKQPAGGAPRAITIGPTPDHHCDGDRKYSQVGDGVGSSPLESELLGAPQPLGGSASHHGAIIANGVNQERTVGGHAQNSSETAPSAKSRRPGGRNDLRVSIPDVEASPGYGTPYSPPHSAPPHKMSMDSIPELTETSGSYDELPNLLLPGLLSPTHQGSLSRLSTRRPSCGVRMAEIRAGMRHGVESLRGSGSLCSDYLSRESLSRDSSLWSVKDVVKKSSSKESLKNLVVSQGNEPSRIAVGKESPEMSSDSSRDNSLRISRRERHKLRKCTPPRGPSLPLTPTSNSSQDSTPSESPRRLMPAHQGTPHISRSVSDDHCVVQSLLQQLHSAKSGARREQFRHSWETSNPSCSQVYSRNPPHKGSMSSPANDIKKAAGLMSEKPYAALSGTGRTCVRDVGATSREVSPTWSYEYVDPEEDVLCPRQDPGLASRLQESTLKASEHITTTSDDWAMMKHYSKPAGGTHLSGISQSTTTTTSVTYTKSQGLQHTDAMHIRNSDPTNWAVSTSAAEHPDVNRHSYPEVNMCSQPDIHALYGSGSNARGESLDSVYEHVYEEPASVISPNGITDMDMFSGSDSLRRSHSAISGHYATLPCRTKPLPKSSSSPSQFKTSKMTLPQENHDASSVKLGQPFDSFRRRQLPDMPTGHGSMRQRHLPDPSFGVDFIRQDISGVRPTIDNTGTLGLRKANVSSSASPPAPDETPKLKYAEVKPVKANKSPKTSIFQSKIGMMFQRKNREGKGRPSETGSQNKKTQAKEASKPRSDVKLPANTTKGTSPKHKPLPVSPRNIQNGTQSSPQSSEVVDSGSLARKKDQHGSKAGDQGSGVSKAKSEKPASGQVVKQSSASSRSESPQIQKGKKGIPGFSRLRHPSGSAVPGDGKTSKPRPSPLPMSNIDQNYVRREESLSPRNKSPSNPIIPKSGSSKLGSGSKVPTKSKGQSTPVSSPPPSTPTRIKSPDVFSDRTKSDASKAALVLYKQQSSQDKGQRARPETDQQGLGHPGLVATKHQRQESQENPSHGRRDSQDGASHLRRDSQERCAAIPKVPPSRITTKLDKAQYGKFLPSSLYSGSVSMHISSSGGEAMSSPRTEELIQPPYCAADHTKVKYGKTRVMKTLAQESKTAGKGGGDLAKSRLTRREPPVESGESSPPKTQPAKVKVTAGTQTEPSLLPRGRRLQRNPKQDRSVAVPGQASLIADKNTEKAQSTPSPRDAVADKVADNKPASKTAVVEHNHTPGTDTCQSPFHNAREAGIRPEGSAPTWTTETPPPRLVRPYASLSRTRPLFGKFGFGAARQCNASGPDAAIPEENGSVVQSSIPTGSQLVTQSVTQSSGRDEDAVTGTSVRERDRHSECLSDDSPDHRQPSTDEITDSVTDIGSRCHDSWGDNEGNKYQRLSGVRPQEKGATKTERARVENEPSNGDEHQPDNCTSTRIDNDNDSVNDTDDIGEGQPGGNNVNRRNKLDATVLVGDRPTTPHADSLSPGCLSLSRDDGDGHVTSVEMAVASESDFTMTEPTATDEWTLDQELKGTCCSDPIEDAHTASGEVVKMESVIPRANGTSDPQPASGEDVGEVIAGDEESGRPDDKLWDGGDKTGAEMRGIDCHERGTGPVKGRPPEGNIASEGEAPGSGYDNCVADAKGIGGVQTMEPPPAGVNRASDVCASDVAVRGQLLLTVDKQRCVNDAQVDGTAVYTKADTSPGRTSHRRETSLEVLGDLGGINEVNTVNLKAGDPIKSDALWCDDVNANECPLDSDRPSPGVSPPCSPTDRIGSSPEISPKETIELVDSFLDSRKSDTNPSNSPPKSRALGPGDITCHFALQDSLTLPPEYHGNTFPDSWPSMPDMRPLTKSKLPILDPVQYGSLDRRKILPPGKRYLDILPSVGIEEGTTLDSDSSEAGNGQEIWETFHSGLTQGGSTGNADPGTFGNLRLSESGYDSWKSHDSGSTIQMGKDSRLIGFGSSMIQEEPKHIGDSWLEKCQIRDEDEMSRDRDSDGTTTVSTISLASDSNSTRTKSCPFGSRTSVTSQDTLHADDIYCPPRIQKVTAISTDKRAALKSLAKADPMERDSKGFAGDWGFVVAAIKGREECDVSRDCSSRTDNCRPDGHTIEAKRSRGAGVGGQLEGERKLPEPASSPAGTSWPSELNRRDVGRISDRSAAASGAIPDDSYGREMALCGDAQTAPLLDDGGSTSAGERRRVGVAESAQTPESKADSEETITPGSENTGAEFTSIEVEFGETSTGDGMVVPGDDEDGVVREGWPPPPPRDEDLAIEQPATVSGGRTTWAADTDQSSNNRWTDRSVPGTTVGPFVPANKRDGPASEMISHQEAVLAAGSWKVTGQRDSIDEWHSGDGVRIGGARDAGGGRLDGGTGEPEAGGDAGDDGDLACGQEAVDKPSDNNTSRAALEHRKQSISGEDKPVGVRYCHPETATVNDRSPCGDIVQRSSRSNGGRGDAARDGGGDDDDDDDDDVGEVSAITSQVPLSVGDRWIAMKTGTRLAAESADFPACGEPGGRHNGRAAVTREATSGNVDPAGDEGQRDRSAEVRPVGRRVADNRRRENIKPLPAPVIEAINILTSTVDGRQDDGRSRPNGSASVMNERPPNAAPGYESNILPAPSLNKCNKNDIGIDQTVNTSDDTRGGRRRAQSKDYTHLTHLQRPAMALTYAIEYEDSLETSDSQSLTSSPSPSVSQSSANCSFDSLEGPIGCSEWDALNASRSLAGQRSYDYNQDIPPAVQIGALFGPRLESPSRTNSAPMLLDNEKSDDFVLGGSANSTFVVNDSCLKRFKASSHLNMRSGDMLGANNAVLPSEKSASETLLESQKLSEKHTPESEDTLPDCQAEFRIRGHVDDEKQVPSNQSQPNQVPAVQRRPGSYKELDRNITDPGLGKTISHAGKIQKTSTSLARMLPKPTSPVRSKPLSSSKGSSLTNKQETPKSRITPPTFHSKNLKSIADNQKSRSCRTDPELRSPSPKPDVPSLSAGRDVLVRKKTSGQGARPVTRRQHSSPAGLVKFDSCGIAAGKAAKQSRRSLPRTLAEAETSQNLGAERTKGNHSRANLLRSGGSKLEMSRSLTSPSSSASLSSKFGSPSHNKDYKTRLQKPKIQASDSRKHRSSGDPEIRTIARIEDEQRLSSAVREDSGFKGAIAKKLKQNPSSHHTNAVKVHRDGHTHVGTGSLVCNKTAVGTDSTPGSASCTRPGGVISVDNVDRVLHREDNGDRPIGINQDSSIPPISTNDTGDQRMSRSQGSCPLGSTGIARSSPSREVRRTKSGSKLPSYRPKVSKRC
ncbi:hypothetical protein LSH36_24g03001 [Paralvinella palmiformis]|uniref:Uncharacterized protein n=1 Tax=Paralvinella palmiformis TaxID=53620 RepID=A0AAD9KAF7_9ANNE|nr:hypothetical protein LSH36_24g03001 [Paralvinella palmiformis]